MNKNIKKALMHRELSLGSWIQIGHPAIAEILVEGPFDWIAIDMEHTDISLKDMTNIFRVLNSYGVAAFARVRENDTLAIRQVLDAGATGVIVPLVNNAKEAAEAVKATKYPPEGVRGFAFCRANNYGESFDNYVSVANTETVVIAMAETKEAVDNIDDIVSVPGLDGVFIGPYDLSGSYGIPGEIDSHVVEKAIRKISNACRKKSKSIGIHVVSPTSERINNARDLGCNFLAIGMDTVFISSALKNMQPVLDQILKG